MLPQDQRGNILGGIILKAAEVDHLNSILTWRVTLCCSTPISRIWNWKMRPSVSVPCAVISILPLPHRWRTGDLHRNFQQSNVSITANWLSGRSS